MMTPTEIEQRIRRALESEGVDPDTLRVAADPYGGWQVRIVAAGFEGMAEGERRGLLRNAMEGEPLSWRQLLAPAEEADAESFPRSENKSLPLWPESLARGAERRSESQLAVFLSDCPEELSRPVTATFYSLRGGVGRSTALAITARLLAEQDLKVVCLDMDLEAPGLASLFGVEGQLGDHQGIVELLLALDQGLQPDFPDHLLPVDENGRLFLLPAGLPGAAYARNLRLLDPAAWYTEDENPLRDLLDGVRTKLPFVPDVVLIDSRTGISAISAPLLFEQADLAMVSLFPNAQAKRGTAALVEGLLAASNRRGMEFYGQAVGPEIRFIVGPLPTGSPEVQKRLWHRALEWVSEWIEPVQKPRVSAGLLELDEAEMTTAVPYREVIAASDVINEWSTDVVDEGSTTGGPYGRVAGWINGFLMPSVETTEAPSDATTKTDILDDLQVETGAAEDQEELLSVFIETDVVRRALKPDYPVILGRKGTGKTALFRKLSELPPKGTDSSIVHPPHGSAKREWHLTTSGFRRVDQEFVQTGRMTWQSFWAAYLIVGIVNSMDEAELPSSLERPNASPIGDATALLDWLKSLLTDPKADLLLEEALQWIDKRLERPLYLVWDGLDVGFGNEREDRERRERALVGLLALIIEWEKQLQNIRFKIMLREDIWRDLRFENKSHLYGRSVALRWSDKITFLKVLLKQLWRSDKLREYVERNIPKSKRVEDVPVEDWGDQDTVNVWELVVGARMSGGNTAFTRNWVWKRLGDANDDHAPRHLLQLFSKAIDWEKNQEKTSSYQRSLIRPNTLVKVLPDVSKQALDAMLEEFKELEPVFDALREIGKTPFNAAEADSVSGMNTELLDLALEVGLLGIHEGTERAPERYRVPELYRLGLGMARKGQA
ncbi:MAG: ParA family protein [Gammaproteobacteria bacterium]|nr:ParA family protein [Gammaproteobacteria bacterium]